MPLYYVGDLDKDLANISYFPYLEGIKYACQFFAYGEVQDVIRRDVTITPALGDLNVKLKEIVAQIGFPEFTRIVQILWAEELRSKGYPLTGALDLNYDGTGEAQLAAIRAERKKTNGC